MRRLILALGPYVPSFAKRLIRQGRMSYRVLTHTTRLLPDFLIIGGQRCGTTSLYSYLIAHPCIAPGLVKEVQYFSRYFTKG